MATSTTVNPTTGEQLREYALQDAEAARAVVRRAHEAFRAWSGRSAEDRAKVVRRIGELLRERSDDLSALMTREMGKPIAHGPQEVELCAAICDWTAEHGPERLADEERALEGGRALVSHRPQGVILGIQPWNFPLYQAIRYSIPNLLAGNTVLLKHSSTVYGSGEALAALYHDAGVPEDAFAVLETDHDTVEELIAMDEVRGVTLTGSDTAGSHIASVAGEHLKKTVMELGSNDAYVVLSDADVARAVRFCVRGRIYNNGETCVAAKRFVVADAVYDEFRDAFVEQFEALTMGDPMDEDTDLGPMAREDLRDELHEQVQQSVAAGATVTTGGEIPDGDGWFYPPTVLEDVAPGSPAYDDELFGPVASLIRVADDAEAMRVANDSRYGLGGGIFSRDEERAVRLARDEFDTGMVNVNTYRLAQPNLPFGGVKRSGYGREHGGFGIREFVNTKAVMIG